MTPRPKKELFLEGNQVVTFCRGLKLPAADGKSYNTDCANAKARAREETSAPALTGEQEQAIAEIVKETQWPCGSNSANICFANQNSAAYFIV